MPEAIPAMLSSGQLDTMADTLGKPFRSRTRLGRETGDGAATRGRPARMAFNLMRAGVACPN